MGRGLETLLTAVSRPPIAIAKKGIAPGCALPFGTPNPTVRVGTGIPTPATMSHVCEKIGLASVGRVTIAIGKIVITCGLATSIDAGC